ncbi:extracellular solute-binding protein [Sulfobacillus harzensis]|uniref:extracellular solute-binding protein n=1 Tax=Sulfobacillus harzensis TaxID=2729629 RepID=UPI001A9A97C1
MNKTRALSVAALFAVAGIAAGCGSTTQTTSAAGSHKNVTITFGWWGGTTQERVTENAIKLFEKKYPYIHVNEEFGGPFNTYFQKLTTEMAGGAGPDVMQMDYNYINQFAAEGALLNLKGAKDISLSNISPSVVAAGDVHGGLYGIPNALNADAVIYNPSKFAQVGYTGNQRLTWSQFASLVNKRDSPEFRGICG